MSGRHSLWPPDADFVMPNGATMELRGGNNAVSLPDPRHCALGTSMNVDVWSDNCFVDVPPEGAVSVPSGHRLTTIVVVSKRPIEDSDGHRFPEARRGHRWAWKIAPIDRPDRSLN
jgi:hypothetical protein